MTELDSLEEIREIIKAVTALMNEWQYLVENKPMSTERAIGYNTCARDLAAALAQKEG